MGLTVPENRKCFKLTRALMGRKASTPGGLSKSGIIPFSSRVTKEWNLNPIAVTIAKNMICRTSLG